MDLVLDITTSAEFWRQKYPADRTPQARNLKRCSECAYAFKDIARLAPLWMTPEFLEPIGGRMQTLVFSNDQRRLSRLHVAHIWSDPIPEGSFYCIDDHVLIASPAFMFLAAATTLSEHALVAFGSELCGRYSFDRREKRGFRTRSKPLTSVDALRHYLAGATQCRGCRKALKALNYVLEGSASPMETFDALALCLPYRLGGYGLVRPALNLEIPLTPKAAYIAGRETCYADMCYLSIKLDIEHHGKLDHTSPEDQARDIARVHGLREMGFEVVELTWDQVNDLFALEYIVQRIAKKLGKRIRKEGLGATEARLAFRREVFTWNESSGRLR